MENLRFKRPFLLSPCDPFTSHPLMRTRFAKKSHGKTEELIILHEKWGRKLIRPIDHTSHYLMEGGRP
jgi:hypothetical protein